MKYVEEVENGITRSHGFVKDGKREGLWHFFYETGEKEFEIEYKAGVEHGYLKKFYRDGQLLIAATNKDGSANGDWFEYYQNGQIKEHGFYTDDQYTPISFWDSEGRKLMENGTGKKIEVYGTHTLADVYEQFYDKGIFINENKISGYKTLGFFPNNKDAF